MTDIVERLRDQGKDAFAKHYSLGMFKLCDDAASEIEDLRLTVSGLNKDWNALRGPLVELVIAYQDADSPAIQDTLRRARLALDVGLPTAADVRGILRDDVGNARHSPSPEDSNG